MMEASVWVGSLLKLDPSLKLGSDCLEDTELSRKLALVTLALLAMLGLATYPSAYAWSSSPQITNALDGSGSTILTVQFDFSQMSDPPSAGHYPTDFQVRTSSDGSSWTEMAPVQLSPTPTTTLFTVTYNLGKVSGTIQVQARLKCSVHGWSSWGPDPAIPVPEFPFATGALSSVLFMAGTFFLFQRRHRAASA